MRVRTRFRPSIFSKGTLFLVKFKWTALFALGFAFLVTMPTLAQTGIYSEFNATDIQSAGEPWMYGVTFGAYFDKHFSSHLPAMTLGPDFRLALQSGSNSAYGGGPAQSLLAVSGGIRAALHLAHQRLNPYVEGLIGVADSQIGELIPDGDPVPTSGPVLNSKNENGGAALDSQGLAGMDFQLSRHLQWRVAEFGYSNLREANGVHSLGLLTFSSGFVVHF